MSQSGKYKNWPAICKVDDYFLRMALSMIDLATQEGRLLAERLPEFFVEQPSPVFFPLSYLLNLWINDIGSKGENDGEGLTRVCEYLNIPVFKYSACSQDNEILITPEFEDYLFETSPNNPEKVRSGSDMKYRVFECQGKKFFITTCWPSEELKILHCIPLECIATDK